MKITKEDLADEENDCYLRWMSKKKTSKRMKINKQKKTYISAERQTLNWDLHGQRIDILNVMNTNQTG